MNIIMIWLLPPPVNFSPMTSIDVSTMHGRIIKRLMKHSTSVLSYHTNLDKAADGVNDQLIQLMT